MVKGRMILEPFLAEECIQIIGLRDISNYIMSFLFAFIEAVSRNFNSQLKRDVSPEQQKETTTKCHWILL